MKWFASGLFAVMLAVQASVAAAQMADVSTLLKTDPNDPLGLSAPVFGSANGPNVGRICFAIQNLTTKTITSAKIHFAIADQFGQERIAADLIRNFNGVTPGSTNRPPAIDSNFQDTNDGSQSCWTMPVSGQAAQGMNSASRIVLTTLALVFSDHTTWQRGQPIARAFNPNGGLVQINLPWATEPDTAPAAITNASVQNQQPFGGNPETDFCASFRNLSNKVANSVTVTFILNDMQGKSQHWLRKEYTGTFTAPILIENKCASWGGLLTDGQQSRQMLVRVIAVNFTDGTRWSRGTPFTKAFAPDGNPYSGAQPVVVADTNLAGVGDPAGPKPPGPPGPGPLSAPVSNFSSGGIGGTLGPSGQLFGDIAWVPVVATSVGWAVDQTDLVGAAVAAVEACRAKAGQLAAGCTPVVKGTGLNSPPTRCASMVFDGNVFRVAFAGTPGDAEFNALSDLRNANGAVQNHQYLATVCNAR